MVKTLSIIFLCALSFLANNLYAQCELSGLKVTVNSLRSNSTSNNCLLNIDLSFYLKENKGNKQVYINLWNSADYSVGVAEHDWTSNSAKMPRYDQMDGTSGGRGPIAIIGIINDNVKGFVSQYSAQNGNISYANGKLIRGTSITANQVPDPNKAGELITHFVVKGIEFAIPNSACSGSPVSLKGNIWGSQTAVAADNKTGEPSIHCYDNEFDFTIGGVTVNASSSLDCAAVPRTFSLSLDVSSSTRIEYQVYVDADDNGVLSKNTNGAITDHLAYTTTSAITVDPKTGVDYSPGSIAIPAPYGTEAQYKGKEHFLVFSYISAVSKVTFDQHLVNYCNVLPVHSKSFSALRNPQRKELVLLKWETATEENNRGFYVQRKVNGQWKNIAFVFSQADNGNSNSDLAYEYKELNTTSGVSQYQIQQVDMDGKTSYSEIRSVGGLNQASSVQVFPNPGVDGKVSLLFKDVNSPKDVIVNDINGRVVKQFKAVRDNSLNIDGLQSGFYTIKVTDLLTMATTVEKVVIKK